MFVLVRGFGFARVFGFAAGVTLGSAAAADSTREDEAAAGSGAGAGVGEGAVEGASLKILCIRSWAAVSCALGSTVSV